jgi:hypothetical protein
MREQDPRKRTVIVRFPDGTTQYWLTDRAFSKGDVIGQNGQRWIVSEVLGPNGSGTDITVTRRASD